MTHLPCGKDATRFRQVQARGRVVVVEAGDEARDAERPDTSGLRVFLHAGNITESASSSRPGSDPGRKSLPAGCLQCAW